VKRIVLHRLASAASRDGGEIREGISAKDEADVSGREHFNILRVLCATSATVLVKYAIHFSHLPVVSEITWLNITRQTPSQRNNKYRMSPV